MKKTALTLLLAFLAFSGEAQTMYDALKFSESNYEGTARTLAMGNAFTALGGDLGAVTINPAGSAVAKYSQFTITPSLNISVNNAKGTTLAGWTSPYCFGKETRNAMTRAAVPNFGIAMNFDTHRTSGIRNVSIGFVANTTNRYQDALNAQGENAYTSFMGALAAATNGYDVTELEASDAYNYSSAPWKSILGVRSGMISSMSDNSKEYIGASEKKYDDGTISLGGPLNQGFQRRVSGSKYDYVFNLGINISDIVYLGANLGISSFYRNTAERFTESAVNTGDFEIIYDGTDKTYFSNMLYDYSVRSSGTGVYGKFGILLTPVAGLRLGAAFTTPTRYSIVEYYMESASTYYTDSKYNASAETPEGEYRYSLISPFRYNLGAAYTFGRFGLVSVDYEMCDYSMMSFKENDTFDNGYFDLVNDDIRNYCGTSHMIRAGVEFKPVPQFAIRAGYGLTTSPEIMYDAAGNRKKVNANTHKGSFGLGYSSNGSFFADVACSMTDYCKEYIYPYNDYITDADGNVTMPSPEILGTKMLWNVLLTIGLRF